jgi:hypothetical protein
MAVGLIMDSAAIVESKEESLLMLTYGWLSGVHHRCGMGAARVEYPHQRSIKDVAPRAAQDILLDRSTAVVSPKPPASSAAMRDSEALQRGALRMMRYVMSVLSR